MMDGKVVVLTGGTSGIGQAAAEELARRGARIILIARDRARAAQALADISRAGPGRAHCAVYADLASIAETRRIAGEIAVVEPRIDVLINNAGALFNRRQLSPEGLEMTFAVNHMAYFVLTEGLKRTLVGSTSARIINAASGAHRGATLDFDDLQSERAYSGFEVYGRSKLCNILFTRELARRLEGSGVTANCLHPGFVATRFGDRSGGLVQALMPIAKLGGINPKKGAQTIVYLASSPEVASMSGLYFYQQKPDTPSVEAQDDGAAGRLWAESERIEAAVAQAA
jgi:NAD(P)-dependent dehydrogenase (short-subunit alcohol dehydrogenase family)